MPISFACPTCRQTLQVSDAAAGRSGKCPHCKGPIVVPAATPAAPVAAFTAAPPQAMPVSSQAPLLSEFASAPRGGTLFHRVDALLKKHSPWSYVAAGGGALLVLLLFLMLLISLFSSGDSWTRAARYFPDQTNVVVSINTQDMLASGL